MENTMQSSEMELASKAISVPLVEYTVEEPNSNISQKKHQKRYEELHADVSTLDKMYKRVKKRRRGTSESFDASDGNEELNDASPLQCDNKRKKIKHEPKKRKVPKTGSLPVEQSYISKKRKLKGSKEIDYNLEAVNNNGEVKDKGSSSETMEKDKAQKEKKKKRRRQRPSVEKINAEKEELSEKYDTEEKKSSRFTLEEIVKTEIKFSCSNSKNFKSSCMETERENGIVNQNTDHELLIKVGDDLQHVSRQDSSDELQTISDTKQIRNNFPHCLIGLMYQLDLSVLCSLRKIKYQYKYPLMSLRFGDSEIDKFNNIVLGYEEKSIYIKVENVDKRHTNDVISYDRLFTKKKQQSFSVNNYFNCFVQHVISMVKSPCDEVNSPSSNIKYLIIYTNSGLDFTKENKLKQGKSKGFYPFQFDSVEKCDILKDVLFTNDNTAGRGFYQVSQDKTTRKEFSKRLQFSSSVQNLLKSRKLSEKFQTDLKEEFLDKFVFAVNQPSREELNMIIRSEIEKNSKVQDNYITLQGRILNNLAALGNHKKLGTCVSRISYEFNLLMTLLHDMFSDKNMFSINFEGKSPVISNDITINYKDRITCVKAHNTNICIGYSQLFPSKEKEDYTFSINKHFALFVEKFKTDLRYFIVYTNADLNLTAENRLKQRKTKDFYPFQFDSIDVQKKRYKVLRNCSSINENDLYRFSHEETTKEKMLGLLKLPSFLQKEKEEGRLSDEKEKEMKEKFLDRLIFAVKQHDNKALNSVLQNELDKSDTPYDNEELREIALRWLESAEFGHITKEIMKKLSEDIKNNRSSHQNIENRDITEEVHFAKSIGIKESTPVFHEFLDYLIKGKGKIYLQVLKKNKISLANMSSILNKAGTHVVKAFEELYALWIDKEGNRTRYLKTLEQEGINLASISDILNGARHNAVKAFKGLYDLWFDAKGYKNHYLKTLEENGVSLSSIFSILSRAGAEAPKAFQDLHNLWFDAEGNKTQYLKTLEGEGISLANVSSILYRARTKAAQAFKELYDLWFDEEGHKTQYIKILEAEGINLADVSNILHGVGAKPSKNFKDLYDLWFDREGNKSQCLKNLEDKGIKLTNISSILSGAGAKAATAFKDLYDLWFDKTGNRTQYLKTLEEKGINLTIAIIILGKSGSNAAKAFKDLHGLWFGGEGNKSKYLITLEENGIKLTSMASVLCGAGANAAKAFKDLYRLWFDGKNKTQYLKILEENRIKLCDISGNLNGAGTNAAKAFKDLHNVWFDANRNKSQYLKTLEEAGINLTNVSSILNGAGPNAAKDFKNLYHLWFDKEGNKTQYITTLEENEIDLLHVSNILHGAGSNASKAFEELCNTFLDEQGKKRQYLEHFLKSKNGGNSFRLDNLTEILGKAGAKVKDAFEKFHNVCFNDEGKITELLDDFYKAGFTPSNLSSILCGSGDRASYNLKRLHRICFNKKRESTKFLNDFCKTGFTIGNLCSLLSGASDNLEKFHYFCFIGDTKRYLETFLNEEGGFTLSNLTKILHGAGDNIYSALKNFHGVCFDEKGKRTKLLNHFYGAGFKPRDLSNVLAMTGNRATSILIDFHESCFNKDNYLNHFLEEEELFRPKDLSKILHRVGTNTCDTFKKLHDLCFDETGKKTKYLRKCMKKNDRHIVLNMLYEKVRES